MSRVISIEGLKYKRMLIISPFTRFEICGGSVLITLLKEHFKNSTVLYIPEIRSLTSFLINIMVTGKNLGRVKASPERRWFLNLLFVITLSLLSRIDFILKKNLCTMIVRHTPDIVVCNYPNYFDVVNRICSSLNIKCVLMEHNVEHCLFKNLLPRGIYAPLLSVLKSIELSAVKGSHTTLVVSLHDKALLVKDLPAYEHTIFTVALFDSQKSIYSQHTIRILQRRFSAHEKKLAAMIHNKKIIGFVGADYEPNILSVENLLVIAKRLARKPIIFLILGTVSRAFAQRKDIPPNVILKGFVNQIGPYLSICDAFANPKTIGDTGIEIKMFEYQKFGKPILCTQLGARGFEHLSLLKIVPLKRWHQTIMDL